jgi:hypothetical protein
VVMLLVIVIIEMYLQIKFSENILFEEYLCM